MRGFQNLEFHHSCVSWLSSYLLYHWYYIISWTVERKLQVYWYSEMLNTNLSTLHGKHLIWNQQMVYQQLSNPWKKTHKRLKPGTKKDEYSRQMPDNKDYISISFNVQKILEKSEVVGYKLSYIWMIWDGAALCLLTLSVLLKLPVIKLETSSVLASLFILRSNSISLNLPSDLSGNTAVMIGLVLLNTVCIFLVGCWKINITLLVPNLLLLMNLCLMIEMWPF